MEKNRVSISSTSPHNFWDFSAEKFDDEVYVIERVSTNGSLLSKASERLRNNETIVKAAVKQKWYALSYASEELRNDESICLEAISQDGYALKFTGDKLKNQKNFVLSAISRNGLALKYASDELRSDIKIVLEAVKQNGLALEYVPSQMKKYENVVLSAVRNNGMSLKFVTSSQRNDERIVRTAIEENGLSIKFASKELQKNKELALLSVQQNGIVYKILPREIQNDRDVCLKAVNNDSSVLKDITLTLRNDKEIVKSAVRQNGLMLEYANPELQNDRELVNIAVSNNGLSLKFASRHLSNDKEIVLTSVRNNGYSLLFCSRRSTEESEGETEENDHHHKDLTDDRDVVRIAIENEPFCFKFASDEIRRDPVFIERVLQNMSLQINVYESMSPEERSLQKQRDIENISKRRSFPFSTPPNTKSNNRKSQKQNQNQQQQQQQQQFSLKWRDIYMMYYDRGIVLISADRFMEAFDDFVLSLVELDKKNFYSDHHVVRKYNDSFNQVMNQIASASQSVMIQQAQQEDWVLKWTLGKQNFGRHLSEKEVEQKRKSICASFIDNILGHTFKKNNLRERWRDEVVKKWIAPKCVNTLIAWYGPSQKKVAYLGILDGASSKPLGYGFEFRISHQKIRGVLILRRLIYHRRFYGRFKNGLREGQGREFDVATNRIIFEGEFRNNVRDGRGKEYSSSSSSSYQPNNSSNDNNSNNNNNSGVDEGDSDFTGSELIVFQGQFKNGKRNGHGEVYDEDLQEFVRGIWENGVLKAVHSKYRCPMIDFETIEKHLKHDSIVGRGAYGLIYMLESKNINVIPKSILQHHKSLRAFLSTANNRWVAVKIFQTGNSFIKREFMFRNIKYAIELCGSVKDKEHILDVKAMIKGRQIGYLFELCKMSVDRIVPTTSSMEEKIRILYQTAKGMKSLHSNNIMHRDLKWGNVLLNKNGVVKITDFDCAKEDAKDWKLNIQPHTQTEVGTAEFQAPEILNSDGKYGIEVDVYSYGIMIHSFLNEINNPFSNLTKCKGCGTPMEKITQNPLSLCHHISKCDLRPNIMNFFAKDNNNRNNRKYKYLLDLCTLCWDKDPRKRPSFSEIVEIFENEMNKQKCYSIIQIMFRLEEEEEQQQKSRNESRKQKSTATKKMKILLMKPSIEELKKLVGQKLDGTKKKVVSMSYSKSRRRRRRSISERDGDNSSKDETIRFPLEKDQDVLDMVKLEESPVVLITLQKKKNEDKKLHAVNGKIGGEEGEREGIETTKDSRVEGIKRKKKKKKNDDEDILEREENGDGTLLLKKEMNILKEKNEKLMLQHETMKKKIEGIIHQLRSSDQQKQETRQRQKQESEQEIRRKFVEKLSQILFEDLTSNM